MKDDRKAALSPPVRPRQSPARQHSVHRRRRRSREQDCSHQPSHRGFPATASPRDQTANGEPLGKGSSAPKIDANSSPIPLPRKETSPPPMSPPPSPLEPPFIQPNPARVRL